MTAVSIPRSGGDSGSDEPVEARLLITREGAGVEDGVDSLLAPGSGGVCAPLALSAWISDPAMAAALVDAKSAIVVTRLVGGEEVDVGEVVDCELASEAATASPGLPTSSAVRASANALPAFPWSLIKFGDRMDSSTPRARRQAFSTSGPRNNI